MACQGCAFFLIFVQLMIGFVVITLVSQTPETFCEKGVCANGVLQHNLSLDLKNQLAIAKANPAQIGSKWPLPPFGTLYTYFGGVAVIFTTIIHLGIIMGMEMNRCRDSSFASVSTIFWLTSFIMMSYMAFGYLPAIKKYNEEAQVFNTTAAVTKFMFENLMLDTGSYFAEWVSAFVLALANACLAGIELFLIICGPWLIYTDKYRATIDD